MTLPGPPGLDIGESAWTDETGRTWNSFGNLVLSDELIQNARQKLAAYLRGVYLDSVNVYEYPPDVLYAAALVINPSDPYVVPYDQGGPGFGLWGFEIVLVTQRAKTDEGLVRLEFMWAQFQELLKGHENSRWISFGEIGTTTIADIEYLTGTVTIGVVDRIQEAS